MAQILLFPQTPAVFDADTATILGQAYEKAIVGFGGEPPKTVQEVIARRIIVLAATGEHDPLRLCEAALRGLKSPQ